MGGTIAVDDELVYVSNTAYTAAQHIDIQCQVYSIQNARHHLLGPLFFVVIISTASLCIAFEE